MEIGDIFWALIWLGAGLWVFEDRSLKNFLDIIGIVVMVFSLLGILAKQTLLIDYLQEVPVSYIGGAITHYCYLIGANIGRAIHFSADFNYGRVFIYGVILIGLIFVLNNLNAIQA